ETVRKSIRAGIESIANARAEANAAVGRTDETQYITQEFINELEAEMLRAADALEFERAAQLRDRIEQVQQQIGKPVDAVPERAGGGKRGKRGGGQRVPRPKRNA
ncbi:MAG: UvrB/UvrC motif-containing protein, partial [Planctomycetaceae bacterium]|nr:UvrB/UvrC motif-containing protein [Planctomycetaceae bacterium]